MFLDPRIKTPVRARVFAALPWVFVVGIAVSTTVPWQRWIHRGYISRTAIERSWPDFNTEQLWGRSNSDVRHSVEVLRTIDGDTFVARVHLKPNIEIVTHVRLRGIDAPELKAACAKELRLADAAADALSALLAEGSVTISNVGPDKYAGRVDADVATARTPNVSAALLAAGRVRRYDGGHRDSWCAGGWR